MALKRRHVLMSDEMWAEVGVRLAPFQSRGDWVRRAVEDKLADRAMLDRLARRHAAEKPLYDRLAGVDAEQALPGSGANAESRVVAPPSGAPAEQPVSETEEPLTNEQADPGSVSSSEGVRSAPAVQPFRDMPGGDRLMSHSEGRSR